MHICLLSTFILGMRSHGRHTCMMHACMCSYIVCFNNEQHPSFCVACFLSLSLSFFLSAKSLLLIASLSPKIPCRNLITNRSSSDDENKKKRCIYVYVYKYKPYKYLSKKISYFTRKKTITDRK